jgi:Lamin Tail Domain/PEP-CTERM motif
MKKLLLGLTTALIAVCAIPAQAQIRITEVSAFSSGAVPANGYTSDWFELTNFGATAVNISGWRIDDSSPTFATAVAMTGITSIAAGESVVFIENAVNAAFRNTWFGGSPPPSLQIGNYTGAGVGFGQGGDAVNIYNNAGVLQASVLFGASGSNLETVPYHTFNNAAGLNNTTISTLSAVGVNGAFVAINDINEIGSPGTIGSIAAVPEPSSYALMLAGFAVIGAIARKRQQA